MKFTQYEIMNNVYDYLFKNDKFINLDFCQEFPSSGIDNDENIIYLSVNDTQAVYKLTIEKV